jgi:hypothetical protein
MDYIYIYIFVVVVGGGTLNSRKILTLQNQIKSELWLVHNPQLQVEVYLKHRDFTCPLPIYLVINATVNNQENLQTH